MNKWRYRIKQWIGSKFDLPKDVMLDLPRITMIGHLHAYIENHQGLITFSDKEILLKVNKGYIKIKGEKIVLKTMLKEEIIVEGKIKDIQYIDN